MRAAAGVEDDQRAVGRDGGGAVEQVGVAALLAPLREPRGEAAAQRGELVRALALVEVGHRQQLGAQHRLARRFVLERRGARVDGADRLAEHGLLGLAQALVAHHQRVQREQERDLLARHPGRVGHVPRVQRERGVGGAELDLLRARDQPGQQLVVAGAVDHERARAAARSGGPAAGWRSSSCPTRCARRSAACGWRARGRRGPGARACGRGRRTRTGSPVGRAAAGADQRDGVGGVAGGVLAGAARGVLAERQRARPQLALAELAAADLAVGGGFDRLGAVVDRLGERGEVGVRAGGAQRLVDRDLEQAGAFAGRPSRRAARGIRALGRSGRSRGRGRAARRRG